MEIIEIIKVLAYDFYDFTEQHNMRVIVSPMMTGDGYHIANNAMDAQVIIIPSVHDSAPHSLMVRVLSINTNHNCNKVSCFDLRDPESIDQIYKDLRMRLRL